MELNPVRFMDDEVMPELARVVRDLAAFVGAEPQDLALVPNATTAVNAVVSSLDLQPGDVCLALSISYGAVMNTLDRRCRRSGAALVRLRVQLQSPTFDPDVLVADLERAIARYGSRLKVLRAPCICRSNPASRRYPLAQSPLPRFQSAFTWTS
jgi:aspartate aminotransferase-like enzyme